MSIYIRVETVHIHNVMLQTDSDKIEHLANIHFADFIAEWLARIEGARSHNGNHWWKNHDNDGDINDNNDDDDHDISNNQNN